MRLWVSDSALWISDSALWTSGSALRTSDATWSTSDSVGPKMRNLDQLDLIKVNVDQDDDPPGLLTYFECLGQLASTRWRVAGLYKLPMTRHCA